MAKISNAKPKSFSGGYVRVFGNVELGLLLSKVQSTVISAGTELEKIVYKILENEGRIIEDFDNFSIEDFQNNVYVVPKKVIKNSKLLKTSEEPDFVVIKTFKRHCYIIELKDGDMFDTKKSLAEKQNLKHFEDAISRKLPCTTSIHICSFNQESRAKIVAGFKGKFTEDEVLTGKEFCEILQINYEEIINKRKEDEKDNLDFFVSELLKIEEVKSKIETYKRAN